MGYISKDIAVIAEPKVVTLSGLPNFVQFESKKAAIKTHLEVNITVKVLPSFADIPTVTLVQINAPSGDIFTFNGTTESDEVGGSSFFVAADTADTAENLRQAILSVDWISANFEVLLPFNWSSGSPSNGDKITIKSKGTGEDFNIQLFTPNDAGNAYTVEWVNPVSVNNDSISGEAVSAEIDLDIYADPDVFLGQDDRPDTPARIGTYLTTLKKTYVGAPLWFDLNALFSQYGTYTRPSEVGWFDPGTISRYRFAAKVQGVNSFYFYQSNALFVLRGRGKVSENLEVSQYVYGGNSVKLLTNKPRTTYVRGQMAFLNFVLSDPYRNLPIADDYTLRVAYRVYSTGENYLGTVYAHEKARADFSIVNTCQLDIDAVLDEYPTAGVVRISLARGEVSVSDDIEYTILPECLHTLRSFCFLNRLGGWDSFNFDAGVKDEIKPSIETYNKTITPSFEKGDSVETVYSNTLSNTFTIKGAPVTDEVAEWLKELAGAEVILDPDGNYIIIEDFTLVVTDDDRNMQIPTIKYRLSE